MNTAKSGRAWLTGAIFSGHYEIGSLIARGGMSEVYHAVDLWSNNPVAVKVLLPRFSQPPEDLGKVVLDLVHR